MHRPFIKTDPNVLITAVFPTATLLARNNTISPNLGRVMRQIRQVESSKKSARQHNVTFYIFIDFKATTNLDALNLYLCILALPITVTYVDKPKGRPRPAWDSSPEPPEIRSADVLSQTPLSPYLKFMSECTDLTLSQTTNFRLFQTERVCR